jgi:hypothetical protein
MSNIDSHNHSDQGLRSFLNSRTLILGEINTGKTTLTAGILAELRSRLGDEDLAVLDLSPEVPKNAAWSGPLGVGGRLVAPGREGNLLYLHPRLAPPRLSSAGEDEAGPAARNNLEVINPALEVLAGQGRPILFINDITLYLQAGSAADLAPYLEQARTVVANGYYGHKLGTGAFSRRERRETEALMTRFTRLITLTGPDQPPIMPMEDEQ